MSSKVAVIVKLVCMVHLIIFLPKIISYNYKGNNSKAKKPTLMVGFENLIRSQKNFNWMKKLDLCLISNNIDPLNQNGKKDIEILTKNGFKIKKIFLPTSQKEFSFSELILDVEGSKIPFFAWDIQSVLSKKHLSNIDAVLFDVIGFGISNDLCSKALIKTIQSINSLNKKLIILDRPNPLGCKMEGPGQIPLRPGITVGELANYLNKYSLEKPINLTIVPVLNWQRNMSLEELNIKNLPSVESCYGYSVLNLLNEINPLKIDTSSQFAYQTILFPKANKLTAWEVNHLKRICHRLGFACQNYSYWDDSTKNYLQGIKIKMKKDVNKISTFNSLLTLMRFLKNRKNINFSYSSIFDDMIGSPAIKDFLQDKISFDELKMNVENSLSNFYLKAKDCFLYKPFPERVEIQLVRG